MRTNQNKKEMEIQEFKTPLVARTEINSPSGSIAFDFFLHLRDSSKELSLDKEKFYRPFCGELEFPHYEIEIAPTSPSEDILAKAKTHYIKGGDGKLYICWPYRTPNLWAVDRIVSGWSAAAFYALATGQDSNVTIGHYCGTSGAILFLKGLVEGLKQDHQILTHTVIIG